MAKAPRVAVTEEEMGRHREWPRPGTPWRVKVARAKKLRRSLEKVKRLPPAPEDGRRR